jgi:bacillithiol biosynthesis cysteine-adding enzyme BshC
MHGVPFLERGAGDPEALVARVREASKRTVDPTLLATLMEQHERFGSASPAPLGEAGCVAVITGQQVGLFLGPLYTLYKAASAVAWAHHITEKTGVRAVPLFWLQTEDHDFAEIRSATLPQPGNMAPLVVTLAGEEGRAPVAERVIEEEICEALVGFVDNADVLSLVRKHYRKGARLADAFAGLLAELFPTLVIFDPRQPATAKLALPIIQRSFTHAAAIDQALIERSAALAAAGFDEQITVRHGSTLAFFHKNGERQRLLRRGDHFEWPGSNERLSLPTLLAADPMHFSSSALLRPIVQDTLLPTALYIGGPAEVDYFGQASALYPLFGLPLPMVTMRSRFRLLTPRTQAWLDEAGLTLADIDGDETALIAKVTKLAPANAAWRDAFEAELAQLLAAEPSLKRVIEKTRRSVSRANNRLQRSHERLVLERDRIASERLQRLHWWLRPDGAPQERVHCFIPFAAKVGARALSETVLAHVDPLTPDLRTIAL